MEEEYDNDGRYDENMLATAPKPKKMFSYDWSNNFVSPFLPTANEHIDTLLTAIDNLDLLSTAQGAQPADERSFWDLGCGDGVALIAVAAKYKVKCVGVELDRALCAQAEQAVQRANLTDLVEIRCEDLTDYQRAEEFSPRPTVMFLFLLPTALAKLRAVLEDLMDRLDVIVAIEVWTIDAWKDRLYHVENNRFYFYRKVSPAASK